MPSAFRAGGPARPPGRENRSRFGREHECGSSWSERLCVRTCCSLRVLGRRVRNPDRILSDTVFYQFSGEGRQSCPPVGGHRWHSTKTRPRRAPPESQSLTVFWFSLVWPPSVSSGRLFLFPNGSFTMIAVRTAPSTISTAPPRPQARAWPHSKFGAQGGALRRSWILLFVPAW